MKALLFYVITLIMCALTSVGAFGFTCEDKSLLSNQQEKQLQPYVPTCKEYVVNGVKFTMVFVEGGTFQMGGKTTNEEDGPIHSVTLSSYYIGQTEVTQALWQAVMGSVPSNFEGDSQPVVCVS